MFCVVNVSAVRFAQIVAVHFGCAVMSYSMYSCSNSRAVPAPDAAPESKRAGPVAGSLGSAEQNSWMHPAPNSAREYNSPFIEKLIFFQFPALLQYLI